jgi:hypothetical protein
MTNTQQQMEAQQAIQMTNPPSSSAWQNASVEIHKLAKVILAEQAIARGETRGAFIRRHMATGASISDCQVWSDAYTKAMGI